MPRCRQCGAFISAYDGAEAARIAGDGKENICPTCAVAVYYAGRHDASEKEMEARNAHDRYGPHP